MEYISCKLLYGILLNLDFDLQFKFQMGNSTSDGAFACCVWAEPHCMGMFRNMASRRVIHSYACRFWLAICQNSSYYSVFMYILVLLIVNRANNFTVSQNFINKMH
jgi:hypothetical protein